MPETLPMDRKNNMKYTHLFFDLDHTLWDFDRNAEETLLELYDTHGLENLGVKDFESFVFTYTRNNHELWGAYHRGEIDKAHLRATRFKKTFVDLGLDPGAIPVDFEDEYLRVCPTKTNLFPDAIDVLQYLSSRYQLHLISNGFFEATTTKIRGCDLERYFENIVISETLGVNKPDPAIFEYALSQAGCDKSSCVMIGDSLEADIKGALDYGMDAIFFNPLGKEVPAFVPRQIAALKELKDLL